MGTRGQVYVKDDRGGVYLYSHYDSYHLLGEVQRALSYRKQWDNCEYLARMIFEEMLKRASEKEYGFGIGVREHGDIDVLVIADCDRETITVKKDRFKVELTFEEYLKVDIAGESIRFSGSPPPPSV